MKNKKLIFTIIAQNYIKYGLTLAKSLKDTNQDSDFIIIFADDLSTEVRSLILKYNINGISIFNLINDKSILDMSFYYEITEYCTAIKPFVIKKFMNDGYEFITYLDPDIFVYKNLNNSVYKNFENHSIIITPHICTPIDFNDKNEPSERVHLSTGTYNLGFISIKNNIIGNSFINWWIEKCKYECFNETSKGLFVDQKWINLVPGLFDECYISRNLGLNVSYWNLHERKLMDNNLINGEFELTFFHFSGYVDTDLNCISKYQNRYSLNERKDLLKLFQEYSNVINSFDITFKLPNYKYSKYTNGKNISLLARRFYFWNLSTIENPFLSVESENNFLKLLVKYNIKEENQDTSIKDHNDINNKAKKINLVLKLILRLIGPNKYASLFKYFGFLGALNHHQFLQDSNLEVISDNRKHLKR